MITFSQSIRCHKKLKIICPISRYITKRAIPHAKAKMMASIWYMYMSSLNYWETGSQSLLPYLSGMAMRNRGHNWGSKNIVFSANAIVADAPTRCVARASTIMLLIVRQKHFLSRRNVSKHTRYLIIEQRFETQTLISFLKWICLCKGLTSKK